MKKAILVLLLGMIPAFAFAAGDAAGRQQADGDNDAHAHPQDTDDAQATGQHGHDGDKQAHDAKPHERDAEKQAHDSKPHGHDAEKQARDAKQAHDATPHSHDSVAGQPGATADIDRTVEVTMDDNMRFMPDTFTFSAGETVRISLQNDGKIPHEFVIGAMSELMEHAEMMRKMPTMQHAEANQMTLAAGAHAELVWQFDKPGTVDFACLIPGHLEAGMKGSVTVL
jgi:uncharacterized cupredoxin-like copper-binding protein